MPLSGNSLSVFMRRAPNKHLVEINSYMQEPTRFRGCLQEQEALRNVLEDSCQNLFVKHFKKLGCNLL